MIDQVVVAVLIASALGLPQYGESVTESELIAISSGQEWIAPAPVPASYSSSTYDTVIGNAPVVGYTEAPAGQHKPNMAEIQAQWEKFADYLPWLKGPPGPPGPPGAPGSPGQAGATSYTIPQVHLR